MVLAPPAPHAPFTPADRHNGKYNGTKAKRTPNFNVPVQQVNNYVEFFPEKTIRIFKDFLF